jgi:hypothetical protein
MSRARLYPHAVLALGVQTVTTTANVTFGWAPAASTTVLQSNNVTLALDANRDITVPNGDAPAQGADIRFGVPGSNSYTATIKTAAGVELGRITPGTYMTLHWEASGAPKVVDSTATPTVTDATNPAFDGRYLLLNGSYTSDTALRGGIVLNFDPTTTQTTTAGYGVFTAGVDGTSDPTVTVAGSGTFSAADLVLITGSANNDGLYEVQGHSAHTLTLKSTSNGTHDRVEDFTRDQLVAGTDTGATIIKVSVTVLRAGADGLWEIGQGSATGITYSDIVTQGDDQVVATCTGGTATGTNTKVISFVLKQKDNSTALTSARQVLLLLSSTQYADAAGPSNASLSLGSVTAGSIQATVIAGQLYLVNTDATGNFSCTATNTDDETVYMNVKTASGGVSSIGSRCTVLGSNSASVVWN